MRLNEIVYTEARPVEGYGPGFFRVGGEVLRGGVLLLPSGISSWAGFGDVAGLEAAAGGIDVLLVGTGADMAPLPAGFRDAMEARGIGLESMASPAAARTYNMLLAEGRRVGAALLAV